MLQHRFTAQVLNERVYGCLNVAFGHRVRAAASAFLWMIEPRSGHMSCKFPWKRRLVAKVAGSHTQAIKSHKRSPFRGPPSSLSQGRPKARSGCQAGSPKCFDILTANWPEVLGGAPDPVAQWRTVSLSGLTVRSEQSRYNFPDGLGFRFLGLGFSG